jgi:hypothetical protein
MLLRQTGKKSSSGGQGAQPSKFNILDVGYKKCRKNNGGGGYNVHKNIDLSSPQKKKKNYFQKRFGAMKFMSVERPARYVAASANVKVRY